MKKLIDNIPYKKDSPIYIDIVELYDKYTEKVDFAYNAHSSLNQTRKISGKCFFIHHVLEVTMSIYKFAIKHDLNVDLLVTAALFHDYKEDCMLEPNLPEEYNYVEFCKLVSPTEEKVIDEVTNQFPKAVKRKLRKKYETLKLSRISDNGKILKLIDRENNVNSYVQSVNDGDLTEKSIQYYLEETKLLINKVKVSDPKIQKALQLKIDVASSIKKPTEPKVSI